MHGTTIKKNVTVEILTAMIMKIMVFWEVMLYSLVEIFQCSVGAHCVHLHGTCGSSHPRSRV